MTAFGYSRTDLEAESPLELREVALAVRLDEIDEIIAFLQHAKAKLKSSSPTPGQSHVHFSFWKEGWNERESDLIVVYDQPTADVNAGSRDARD